MKTLDAARSATISKLEAGLYKTARVRQDSDRVSLRGQFCAIVKTSGGLVTVRMAFEDWTRVLLVDDLENFVF